MKNIHIKIGLNVLFNGVLGYARLILKKFHLAFETVQVTRFARIRFLAVMLHCGVPGV